MRLLTCGGMEAAPVRSLRGGLSAAPRTARPLRGSQGYGLRHVQHQTAPFRPRVPVATPPPSFSGRQSSPFPKLCDTPTRKRAQALCARTAACGVLAPHASHAQSDASILDPPLGGARAAGGSLQFLEVVPRLSVHPSFGRQRAFRDVKHVAARSAGPSSWQARVAKVRFRPF